MKKISERAVALMVARHKKIDGPSPGFSSFYDYMTRTAHKYPSASDCISVDILAALDEWQAETHLPKDRQCQNDESTNPKTRIKT